MTDADPWQSLGTQTGHVEIAEYSPDWPLVFEREAAAILEACSPWVTEVHHVGSTSVPGLAAKPILDMMPIAAGPAEGHPAASKHLVFRDHLRTHPDAARDYEQLKRELATKYRDDRRTYTDSKADFIAGVIEAATDDLGNECTPTRAPAR